jgi:hypothetical protein
MTRMTRTARTCALLAASTVLAGGVSAAAVGPAQAATVCNVKVVSVRAWDLNDNDGKDEMKIKIGDSPYWGPWDMRDDQFRSTSLGNLNKDFVGTVNVGVYEQDITRQTIDVDSVGCGTLGNVTLDLIGNGAIYEMVVNVTQH